MLWGASPEPVFVAVSVADSPLPPPEPEEVLPTDAAEPNDNDDANENAVDLNDEQLKFPLLPLLRCSDP